MDFNSDRDDLIAIVNFADQLVNALVDRVPEQRAQYRRVWCSSIHPKIRELRAELRKKEETLKEAGLTGEELRLKYDAIHSAATQGALRKALKLEAVSWMLSPIGTFRFPLISLQQVL